MRFKTPADGNCYYHAMGEQVGRTALEVRKMVVEYLRENQRIGEEWSGFINGGERGKRAYLRAMATEGEWADHVMRIATAKALGKQVVVYSQTEKTVLGGENKGGRKEEIMVGYIRELHYFGMKRTEQQKTKRAKERKSKESEME